MLKKIKEQPFWVGLAITAVAAAAPATAAIWGNLNKEKAIELAQISKEKDLELATREQRFKMRMDVLDRAVDPNRAPEDRKEVLRFLVAVAEDDLVVKQWAEDKLASIDSALKKVLTERDQARTSLWDSSPLGCILSTVRGSPKPGSRSLTDLSWLAESMDMDTECKIDIIHVLWMEMDDRGSRYYWTPHQMRNDIQCSCDKAPKIGSHQPGLLVSIPWTQPPPELRPR